MEDCLYCITAIPLYKMTVNLGMCLVMRHGLKEDIDPLYPPVIGVCFQNGISLDRAVNEHIYPGPAILLP